MTAAPAHRSRSPRVLAAVLGLLTALAVVGLLLTRHPSAEGPPRGAAVTAAPAPGESLLILPISLPLADLAASVEADMPEVLVDETGAELRDGWLVDLHAERTGPVTAAGVDGRVVLEVPLSFSVRAYREKKAERRAARGAEPPEGARVQAVLVVETAVALALTRDWALEPTTEITHRWTERPTLILGPLHIGIEKLADKALDKQWVEMTDRLDARMRSEDRFRSQIEASWAQLGAPVQTQVDPPTWWAPEPEALYATEPVITDDTLQLTLGIAGRFRIVFGELPPLDPPPPLPDRADPPADSGFVLEVPVHVQWPTLSASAKAAVVGQSWPLPVGGVEVATLTPTDIEVYPSGEQLVVALSYEATSPAWTTDGTLYLTGRPLIDPAARELRVEDFEYVLDTWDRAVASASALTASGVKEAIEERLVHSFGPALDTAREQASGRLSAAETPDGGQFSGSVDALELRELLLTDEALVVLTSVRGELSLEVDGGVRPRRQSSP